jgi:histidine triad (HIT) family protein
MKCLFCQIINRGKNAYIIAENEGAIAILDLFSVSDGHILLISRQHFTNIVEVDPPT